MPWDYITIIYNSHMSEVQMSEAKPSPLPTLLSDIHRNYLNSLLKKIEKKVNKDAILIVGNMEPGMDIRVRIALEQIPKHKDQLLVILHTPGGEIEVVKKIVATLRHFYKTVDFLVPVQAMSAGTVLVMSGDEILMDYFSCLGPIDPQIIRNGRYVPALSYLRQYHEMIKKSKEGELTNADIILLDSLDLAELDQIELTASLSVSLITNWLSQYKFKDWNVDQAKKEERAKEIATELNNQNKWFVHGHGIHKDMLSKELHLKIKDYGQIDGLKPLIWQYFWPAMEINEGKPFVHSRGLIL